MNEAVPQNEAAVVSVLSTANCNNRSPTSTHIKDNAKFGTKAKEIAPIAEVTPPIKARRIIWRIGWVSTILAPTLKKNGNVAIAKIMRPKIVKAALNLGAWEIFDGIAAVGPNL